MIGQTFNYLTVLERDSTRPKNCAPYYNCQCTCGNIKSIRKDDILTGGTKSCGCKQKELKRASAILPTNTSFFTEDSLQLSYFLGFFLADGYMTKDNKIGIQLQERDSESVKRFSTWICNEDRVQIIDKNKRDDGINRQNQYRFIFTNDVVFDIFTHYGWDTNKSVTAKVPEHLKYNPHFWRGMIDGDGTFCITKGKFLIDLIGTLDVVTSFKNYCHSIGVGLKKDVYRVGESRYNIPLYSFRSYGKEALLLGEFLYRNKEDAYMERKYEKYLQATTLYK